ncbi:MAG: Gfo/Idh/MocA family oxidoreductase [Candidatus Brocadiia bacterium]|jgi:predicted dehydrogenase|nr:Gfo/Idh/MocA family oxidoreductase [Candidatus Brocadiia bacterium]
MHKVLVVGGGSIGERHARCFINTGRAEVALCEAKPQRLEEMTARHALSATFDDFEKIDLSRFDAAVICVPPHLHVPYARRAAEAGCHVFIEKPLSLDLAGIPELGRTAEQKGLTVGVAFLLRATRIAQMVKDEIDSGRPGEILDITCVCGYDHRVARPDYRSTYAVSKAMGGGAIPDQLSHRANLIQWFLGPVRQVVASYERLAWEDVDVEDTLSALLRFRDSRAMCNIHVSMWHPCQTNRVTLSSNDEQVICDSSLEKVGILRRETGEWNWTPVPAGKRDAKGQVDEPFVLEANNFLDAVEGKAAVLCSLEEAAHTVEVCMAAAESGRLGCAVEI